MKSELSFLVELLLEHRLPKPTQKAVKDRIAEVEAMMSTPRVAATLPPPSTFATRVIADRPSPTAQPESTRKLLEKHGLASATPEAPAPPQEELAAPGIPAANGVTAAALAARQQMIMEGIAGPKKGSVASPKAHGAPRGG